MAVTQSTYELFEETFGHVFFKLAPFAYEVEEITSCCDFNDEEYMFLGLKILKEAHNILVSSLLQNNDFLKNFASLRVLTKVLLVDALDGYHL